MSESRFCTGHAAGHVHPRSNRRSTEKDAAAWIMK